jgi:KaiC/GvpD/RAD55 family RecA-like ATPase
MIISSIRCNIAIHELRITICDITYADVICCGVLSRYRMLTSLNVAPTGIAGFDNLIGGGFQAGSLIMLAGNPGTGKTVFGSKFLATGVDNFDEPCIYVSFGEKKETMVDNMGKQFGPEMWKALRNDKLKFLEYTVMTEVGLDAILKSILDQVRKTGAKRLVIDSYTAMSQLFEKGESRSVMHAVLGEPIRDVGCTTIVICEGSRDGPGPVKGVEEFVADGVVQLSIHELDGRPVREVEILKMRGRRLGKMKCIFTLQGGFEVFEPIQTDRRRPSSPFNGITDSPDRYSTGLVELDRILSGGYSKGDMVLLEVGENISPIEYSMFTLPCVGNFLSHDKAVVDIPSVGVGMTLPESLMKNGHFTAEQLDRLLTLCVPKEHVNAVGKNSKVWTFDGGDVTGSLQSFTAMIGKLTETFQQTSLYMEGIDTLFSSFGSENVVKILNATITASRTHGNLDLIVLRPGIPSPSLYDMLRSIADVHLKIIKRQGNILFYGLKPWTGMFAVQTDQVQGYPWPRLVPLV